MRYSLYFGTLLLAGCASFMDPSKMTAEQLKAMAADQKGIAYCLSMQNATGNVRGVYANLDLVNKVQGSVSLDPDCKLTINSQILQPQQAVILQAVPAAVPASK